MSGINTKKSASIIVTTYNRSDLLKRALKSIECQTLQPECFEIIVVDDGSDDDTVDVVREISLTCSQIRLISNEMNRGASLARNRGLALAKGDYILFTDDDCVANADWAEKMCATLDREPVVAGAIASPASGYIKLCHNIAQFHPFMPGRISGRIDFLAGANMGLHRSVLDELGGFEDEMILAGDTQLCLRARSRGYRPFLNHEAVVLHDPLYISLSGAFKSSYRHAKKTILLRNKYRSLLRTPFVLRHRAALLLAGPMISLFVTAKIYLNPRLLSFFWTAPLVFFLKWAWCLGAAVGLRKTDSNEL
ncbi:MAG: glycosyltransferase family 2 protein [Candidatus Aminicenantes bacterium]|nr:glycosyltransferase family 2 protein [Candidatus Aminicenantes bacterium]